MTVLETNSRRVRDLAAPPIVPRADRRAIIALAFVKALVWGAAAGLVWAVLR